jgi:hypothetical protein
MEKLFAKIKKEALKPDEKAKIFSELRSFVAKNPIQSIRSPFYDSWFIFRYRTAVIPVVLVVILTASTVFAAQNSLPGSVLYQVKMLKENVESLATNNAKAKAQIEAIHAISRLQEVEQIVVSSGQLNTETRKQIENNFESQVQNVTNNVNKLRKSGHEKEASKIQSDFQSKLAEHEKTITELSNSTSTEMKTRKELSNVVSNISELKKRSEKESSGSRDQVKKYRQSKNRDF